MTPQLLQSAIGCSPERAALYAEPLDKACTRYSITGSVRLAAFLAQIAHESGALRYTAELWGPTPAQQRYEGRKDLGNTRLGDGFLYRGRGLIQVTGRANYAAMSARLGVDLEAAPELLEKPEWAALSAADWWAANGCNALADSEDFTALTRRINGGTNGLDDRLQRWARAKQALAAAAVEVPAPAPVEPATPAHAEQAPPAATYTPPRPDQEPYTQPEAAMPIPALVGALLPAVVDLLPSLSRIFKPGSPVAERNVAAAGVVLDTVVKATNAVNAQDAIERMKNDPAALAAAAKEVNAWVEMVEAGGGGIDAARKADAAARAAGYMLHSPSFWVTMALLPLVYMVVGSVVGLWGGEWPSDVRAAIATAVVSLIVGGAAGYYWGQTTGRNRTPAP